MKNRLITATLTVLLALLVSPASAQFADTPWWQDTGTAYERVEWTHFDGSTWTAIRVEMDTDAAALAFVEQGDPDTVAEFGMVVLAADVSYDLTSAGFSPVYMYGGLIDRQESIVLIMAMRSNVWAFVFTSNSITSDAEDMAFWSVSVASLDDPELQPGPGFQITDIDSSARPARI